MTNKNKASNLTDRQFWTRIKFAQVPVLPLSPPHSLAWPDCFFFFFTGSFFPALIYFLNENQQF